MCMYCSSMIDDDELCECCNLNIGRGLKRDNYQNLCRSCFTDNGSTENTATLAENKIKSVKHCSNNI